MKIQEIKERLPLRAVLRRYGLEAGPSGRMRCPFHEDTSPSFQVYDDTDRYMCFAAGCAAGSGDIIDFIERKEGCSTGEAIRRATTWAEGLGGGKGWVGNGKRPAEKQAADPERRRLITGKLFERYRESFARGRKARTYLESRGLDAERLDVGYNSGRWTTEETAALLKEAEAVGLVIRRSEKPVAFAAGCVIFPLRDAAGDVVSLYGRRVGGGGHYYQRGRCGLYPAYPPAETRRLVLCESVIDAASVMQLDMDSAEVLALYGTNGWTAEHAEAARALDQLEDVVLCFDGDEAGQAAADDVAGRLRELAPSVEIRQVQMPAGADANSVLANDGPEALRRLIEEADLISSPEPASPEEPRGTLDTSNPQLIVYRAGQVTVTIRGGIELDSLDRLRVAVKIERTGSEAPFWDRQDLYRASGQEQLARGAAERLNVSEQTLRSLIARMTGALEAYRLRQLEAQAAPEPEGYVMTRAEREEALAFLRKPGLLARTSAAIEQGGVVGEELNRLLMYLAFTSRKREQPLHVMSLASSGSGKTHLQERVAGLMPPEEVIETTALSENALYYFDKTALKGKLLVIEDLDGAEDVLYPLRELQSKGKLSKTVPMKDERGHIRTVHLEVEGPVCVAGATTQERLFEDNANRALLLHLDESEAQSARILRHQRRRSAGEVSLGQERQVRRLVQNAQRLLRPVSVVNPYASQLSLPPVVFKKRRANSIYLALIETIAFYHQHQRGVHADEATGEQYIRVTLEDIEAANDLIAPVLIVKSDELPKVCRRFLEDVRDHLAQTGQETFTQGAVRRSFRMAPATVGRYVRTLRAYGLIRIVGGRRYRGGYEYELTPWGRQDGPAAAVKGHLVATLRALREAEAPSSDGETTA